jgi:hypothetical protein
VPEPAWFAWQAPAPSQVSGSVHSVSEGLPHAVPGGENPLS